jgi:hypothetical protein
MSSCLVRFCRCSLASHLECPSDNYNLLQSRRLKLIYCHPPPRIPISLNDLALNVSEHGQWSSHKQLIYVLGQEAKHGYKVARFEGFEVGYR